MDCIRENEELLALKELREEYENQLKIFGIDLSDFSDEIITDLNRYANIKESLKLSDLTLTNLEELFLNRMRTKLDYSHIKTELKIDVMKLEKEIEKENASLKQLENFIKGARERFGSEEQMEKEEQNLNDEIKILKQKLNHFLENPDVDLDQIIAKVEQIQALEKK